MRDVECEGSVDMSGGAADSLASDGDIRISKGTVKGNVEADGSVTLVGSAAVSGDLSGNDVTVYATGSGAVTVAGSVAFSGLMILDGSNYKFAGIDGQSSGTLNIRGHAGTLPPVTGASVSKDFSVHSLALAADSEFAASAKLSLDTLAGPGAVTVQAGNLTVNSGVSGSPVLDFNGTASSGAAAFPAKSGTVPTNGIVSFGYGFDKTALSSGYDSFTLKPLSGNGVRLNLSSAVLKDGNPVLVKASVSPSLPQTAQRTKLCWKLMDPSSGFCIRPDATGDTCEISPYDFQKKPAGKAVLAACLADGYGNVLPNYKSSLCIVAAS